MIEHIINMSVSYILEKYHIACQCRVASVSHARICVYLVLTIHFTEDMIKFHSFTLYVIQGRCTLGFLVNAPLVHLSLVLHDGICEVDKRVGQA